MYNVVAPYRYLLPTAYLSVADIANPDLFACGCRTKICMDITNFYEEQCQPSSGSACPACPKNGKRDVSNQFAQQFAKSAVTAPPLVGCVF